MLITGTRWSSKNDAVVALDNSFMKIIQLLFSLQSHHLQSRENKATAKGLINSLCKFENIILLKIWRKLFIQFERVNKSLQSSNLNLQVTHNLYKSLIQYLENCDEEFEIMYTDAFNLFSESKNFTGGNIQTRSTTLQQSPDRYKDELKHTLFATIIQALLNEMRRRG